MSNDQSQQRTGEQVEIKTMNVFRNGEKEANVALHIQPGKDIPMPEYMDGDGKPQIITIQFERHKAVVSEELGRWMISKGLADRDRKRIKTMEEMEN